MKILGLLALTLALTSPTLAMAAERTKLTIYTALENDQLVPFKAGIERAVPEVEVVWVRDSTGVITARFLAEKDNPRADMVMGLAASSLLLFEKQGLLATYEPKGADALKPAFRDSIGPYSWTGTDASIGVVCFNTAEAEKDGVKTPVRWADLLVPALKGKVVMPHPASSGTGYLLVAGWLQGMGEEAGWAYMDKLHENIAAYLHSGSAPCVQAARGERTAGLSLDMRGASEKTKGRTSGRRRPRRRHGLGRRGLRHRRHHQAPGSGPQGRRLGHHQGRQRTLRQELRGGRLSGRRQRAGELPRQCRGRDDQERSRLDGRQP